jgi:hypothetical protein
MRSGIVGSHVQDPEEAHSAASSAPHTVADNLQNWRGSHYVSYLITDHSCQLLQTWQTFSAHPEKWMEVEVVEYMQIVDKPLVKVTYGSGCNLPMKTVLLH